MRPSEWNVRSRTGRERSPRVARRRLQVGALSLACVGMLAAAGTASAGTLTHRSRHSTRSRDASLGGPHNARVLTALYKRARAAHQTKVTVYGPSAITDGPLYAAFHKEFPGMTATGVPALGPTLYAKIAAEFASGKHIANVVENGASDIIQYAGKGWITPYRPSYVPHVKGEVGPKNEFVGMYNLPFVVAYNKNEVPKAQVPRTWQALLNPKWKNQLVTYDPRAAGPTMEIFAALDATREYKHILPGLHAQNIALNPTSQISGPLTDIAEGAKKIAIGLPYSFVTKAESSGAPVAVDVLKNYNMAFVTYSALLRHGPDPLAAKLFESWELTPQAARVFAQEDEISMRPGSPSPKGLPPYHALRIPPPILPLTRAATAYNNAIARAKAIWAR